MMGPTPNGRESESAPKIYGLKTVGHIKLGSPLVKILRLLTASRKLHFESQSQAVHQGIEIEKIKIL